jgi:hypothetical protein
MAPTALPLIGVAMLALAACDLSQQKPHTIRTAMPKGYAGTAPALPDHQSSETSRPDGASVQDPLEPQAEGATPSAPGAGGASIRLYGPGVSRKRQTRV